MDWKYWRECFDVSWMMYRLALVNGITCVEDDGLESYTGIADFQYKGVKLHAIGRPVAVGDLREYANGRIDFYFVD